MRLLSIATAIRPSAAPAITYETAYYPKFGIARIKVTSKIKMKLRYAAALGLISNLLTGCVMLPPQLSPPTHLVNVEPDGTIVKDECVVPMQIALSSMRIECVENDKQVVEVCSHTRCSYSREGKVFRECTSVDDGLFSSEADCLENGAHVSRECDRGWTMITCTETAVK
jgi:hypothetical protein